MQLRQDRSVHVREILLVPSPDEGGGNQGDKTLVMDRQMRQKKCKSEENSQKLTKKENQNNKVT